MLRSAATLFHYTTIISGHISTAVKILFAALIQSVTLNSKRNIHSGQAG